MAKKIIGIVLALAMVFSVAVCTVSASAFELPKINSGFDFDLDKLAGLGDLVNPLNWFKGKDKTDTETPAAPVTEDTTEATTERTPLIDFYIDYDVVRTLNWGIRIGNPPTTTTTQVVEPVEEPVVTEAPETTAAPVEEVEVPTDTPLAAAPVEVIDSTPLADVEQVANTGDAGIAAIVAISAVSAAAFVVAKKK